MISRQQKSRDHYGISMQILLNVFFQYWFIPLFILLIYLLNQVCIVELDFLKIFNIIPLHKTGDDNIF